MYLKIFLATILLLLPSFFSVSMAEVRGYSVDLPVEKNKKANKKSKLKNAKKSKEKRSPKSQKALEKEAVLVIKTIIFYIVYLAGVLIYALGATLGLLWILGLCLMVASFVYALIIHYLSDGFFELFFLFLGMVAGNFIVGLTFLIYGAIVMIPLLWIFGIILMCLAIVFWIVMVLMSPIN